MFIKEIVVDGFKSYGQRTEIKGFDRQFNAITGLNGSGKSNILDSICFVLGISNLTQVRANSLQDLIYKSGQTGVNKASVSVTFDNRNKEQSPPGFEDIEEIVVTRQVIMGGKSKYLLNGVTVTNKRVQDLFCSVQLNVNNPHFLIMQGRITKVLNMKPPEILAMIEEAAGTRMYEVKRQAAQKTIEKKDAKLQELDAVIRDEISPKLDKLREERSLFMEFQGLERELEYLMSLYQAYMFFAMKKRTADASKNLEASEAKIDDIKESIFEGRKAVENLDKIINDLSHEAETGASGKLEELEAALKAKEKEEIQAKAKEKGAKGRLVNEEKKLQQLEKSIKDDEKAVKQKEDEMAKVQGLFQKLRDADDEDTKAFQASQKKFEAVSAGMEVNEDGEAATLQEQLMKAAQDATQASTEMKQAEMQLTFSERQLKEKQMSIGKDAGDYQKDKTTLTNVQKEVQDLTNAINKLNFSDEKMREVHGSHRQLSNELRNTNDKIESFDARRPYCKFTYRDPEPNFNKKSVHGVVCRLIKMKDNVYATALETAAGGKLYNVVVDTDVTGKKLLQRGQLQQRVTFIPLNKIQSSMIDNRMAQCAQNLVGSENVQTALSLIEYDPVLHPAMMFIFGNVFICKDLEVAKKVAFHRNIMRRCVTIEGDVVDPSGTLSGGARQKDASLLLQVQEILSYEKNIKERENHLRKLESELRNLEAVQENYMKHKQRLEMKEHEMQMLERKLQQTSYAQQQQEVDNLKANLVQLREKIKQCQETENKNKKLAKDLEMKMKDSKGHREKQLKEAEAEMRRLKAKAETSRKEWKKHEENYQTLDLEISELKKTLEGTKEALDKCAKLVEEINEEIEQLKNVTEKLRKEVVALQATVKEEKNAIALKNKEIQRKVEEKDKKIAEITEFELEIKRQEHEVKKFKDELELCKSKERDAEKRVEKGNKHMREAEELDSKSAANLEKRIREAQEKKTKLSRMVNAKAQSMFEQEEKQFLQVMKKKGIVENDRKKLLSVMLDLDKKKKEVIDLALKQISKDFGSIFSTLLPGANSRLEPMDRSSISKGLEVKVSLGGVWKESLTELSGGQRSLVALSLVLAMLLFKPAPLYILDEIDAALDLSHTQNIGSMLRSHFKQSQFIIVSLKDGMFNNANVLFRTRFVDGMSSVERTVNSSN